MEVDAALLAAAHRLRGEALSVARAALYGYQRVGPACEL
jgi:hypothetical protein